MCFYATLTHIVPSLWLPQSDVLRCQPDDVAGFVDDTGSGTACADIDADIVILLDVHFISDVDGALRARRVCTAVSRAERHCGRHGAGTDRGVSVRVDKVFLLKLSWAGWQEMEERRCEYGMAVSDQASLDV